MKLTDAEWRIMNALWEGHPATAREIMDRLPMERTWAYTTIKTMLARLTAKKAVSETKSGHRSLYRPLVSQTAARRTALRNICDRVLGGSLAPLMHFLEEEKKISEKERRELIRVLEEMDRPAKEINNESAE